jgi:two-component system, OmpR family, phosphate regulon sensor histidine kinase PhoR
MDRPDYASLIAGQTIALDVLNAGDARNPEVLDRLLETARSTLHAAGISLAEPSPTGCRVVAATGAVEWALGRLADLGDLGTGIRHLTVDPVAGGFAAELHRRGLRQMLVAPVKANGAMIARLHAHYPTGPEPAAEHHAVLAYLAAFVAHLHRDRADLIAPTRFAGSRERDHDLFVAVASHELRTPVTVIKGYADTLDTHWASLEEAERREAVRVISQRAGELARLVDRLLLTTDEIGTSVASPPTPFDLTEALRSAVAELPSSLRDRLAVDLPGHLPKALGDRASISTVLLELVTNADKYSPSGTPVELTATADEDTVGFRVADRGIGIRPEHAIRAFDRFWQADTGDRRRYRGVGLGLYLVRKIVERQNGRVSLYPREGGGTAAEVRLPRG